MHGWLKFLNYFFSDWVADVSMFIGIVAFILSAIFGEGNNGLQWYHVLAFPGFICCAPFLMAATEMSPPSPVLIIFPVLGQIVAFWCIGKILRKLFSILWVK